MTLARLLEIDPLGVPPEAQASLLLAERVWSECGKPVKGADLVAALEEILRRCVASDIWYAPVLLLRKKSLERGTWRPRSASARPAPVPQRHSPARAAAPPREEAAGAPPEPSAPGGDAASCPRCRGEGFYASADGRTGYLCPCGAWRKTFSGRVAADARLEQSSGEE